jgi:hypothetical protein
MAFRAATLLGLDRLCLISCISMVGEKSGQGGMDDVPLPATPCDPDALLEPDAPLDPVAGAANAKRQI